MALTYEQAIEKYLDQQGITSPGYELQRWGNDLGNSFVGGLQGGVANVIDAGGYVADSLGAESLSKWLYENAAEWERDAAARNEQLYDPTGFANRVVSGIGSSLPMMVPGVALGGVGTLLGAGKGLAGAMLMGTLGASEAAGNAGQLHRQKVAEGMDPGLAKNAANRLFWTEAPIDIASEYALGMFGGQWANKLVPNPLVRTMIGEALQEGAQETYQGIFQKAAENAAGKGILDYGRALWEEGKNAPAYFMEEGAPAMVSGALMGGVGGIRESLQSRRERQTPQEKQAAANVEKVVEAINTPPAPETPTYTGAPLTKVGAGFEGVDVTSGFSPTTTTTETINLPGQVAPQGLSDIVGAAATSAQSAAIVQQETAPTPGVMPTVEQPTTPTTTAASNVAKVQEAIAANTPAAPTVQAAEEAAGVPVEKRGGTDENGNFVLGEDVKQALRDIASINDMSVAPQNPVGAVPTQAPVQGTYSFQPQQTRGDLFANQPLDWTDRRQETQTNKQIAEEARQVRDEFTQDLIRAGRDEQLARDEAQTAVANWVRNARVSRDSNTPVSVRYQYERYKVQRGISPQENGQTYNQIIGEQGVRGLDDAKQVQANQSIAQEMEAAGKDAKTIRMATGWERGADGKWRYEIMDGDLDAEEMQRQPPLGKEERAELEEIGYVANILESIQYKNQTALDQIRQLIGDVQMDAYMGIANKLIERHGGAREARNFAQQIYKKTRDDLNYTRGLKRLSDVYKSPDLYKAYPSLAGHTVRFARPGELAQGQLGGYDPMLQQIVLNRNLTPKQMRGTLIHEIQHAIQQLEGFAKGGSVTMAFGARTSKEAYDVLNELRKRITTPQTREEYAKNAGWSQEETETKEFEDAYNEYLKSVPKKVSRELDVQLQQTAALDVYERLGGEQEAEAAAKRADMTAEERRANTLESSEGAPRKRQIIKFNQSAPRSAEARQTADLQETATQQTGQDIVELNAATVKNKESRDYMRGQMLERGMTKKDADDLLKLLEGYADKVLKMGKKVPTLLEWNKKMSERIGLVPVPSAFKRNGEYDVNFDMGALCTKREAMDLLVQILVDKKLAQNLGPTQIEALKSLLKDEGFLTACDFCFVESKRTRMLSDANKTAYAWKSVLLAAKIYDDQEIYTPRRLTAEQKARLERMADTRKDGEYLAAYEEYMPEARRRTKRGKADLDTGITPDAMGKIAKLFLEDANNSEDGMTTTLAGKLDPGMLLTTRGTDKLIRTFGGHTNIYNTLASMYGAATSKPLEGFTVYDSLSWKKDFDGGAWDRNNQALYNIGGSRSQSFTDFNPMLFIDYLQMITDHQIRQMPMHTYTKVPAHVELFGESGMMINMSLGFRVAEGVDAEHAGLIPDGKGGYDYAYAEESFPPDVAYRLRTRKEYGGRVGTIAVGLSDAHILKMLDDARIDMVIPYHASGLPFAVKVKTGLNLATDYTDVQETKGRPKGVKEFSYNEALQRLGDPRKAANEYLQWCKDNGYQPKFPQFANHKNYYKLLEDFRGYDNNGKPVLQGPLRLKLPNNWQTILTDALTERGIAEKKMADMATNERLMKKVHAILDSQRLDGELREKVLKKLTTALGKGNIQTLRQDDFLNALETVQARKMGEAKAKAAMEVYRRGDGVVNGFAVNGRIVLNEQYFNSNTPAHEFTHVWAKVAQVQNTELWQEGVSLLKQHELWNEVVNDPLYKNISKDENAIASEVLARFVGLRNEEYIRSMLDPTEKMKKGSALTEQIREWVAKMFNTVRSLFAKKTGRDLTFDEFIKMPLKAMWNDAEARQFRKAVKKIQQTETTAAASQAEMMAEAEQMTQTPEFKRWFGDSKVVDENGAPKVMYHVSGSKDIQAFQSGNSAGLIYFSDTKNAAKKGARSAKYTYPVYLKAQNPVNTQDTAIPWYEAEDSHKVARWRRQGKDSVYVKDESGVSLAVFSPEQIKSVNNRGTFDSSPNIYNQESTNAVPQDYSDLVRAQIKIENNGGTLNDATITLFSTADRSSFIHEFGHKMLDDVISLGTNPDAGEVFADDLKVVMNWFGVKDVSEIGDEQHEQFARGFERYLMEGKAPTSKLAEVFEHFKQWLIDIYRNVANLDVELSPEVRGLFDRLLGKDMEAQTSTGTQSATITGPALTERGAAFQTQTGRDYSMDYATGTSSTPTPTSASVKKSRATIREIFDRLREIRPVRKGVQAPKDVLGYTDPTRRVARTRWYGDWVTATHEIGHIVDYQLKLRQKVDSKLSAKIDRELQQFGLNTSPPGADAAYLRKEGIAEFFRLYAILPDLAEQAAPEYSKLFQETLADDPDLKAKVDGIFEVSREYWALTPEEKIRAGLRQGDDQAKSKGIVQKVINGWEQFREQFDDRLRKIEKIQNVMRDRAVAEGRTNMLQNGQLKDEYAPYDMFRTAPGFLGKAKRDVRAIMDPIMKIGTEAYDSLVSYMTAKRAIDYWNNDLEPGIATNRQQTEDFITQFEKDHGDLVKISQDIASAYEDMVRRTMIDSGVWSEAQYEEYKKKWPNYVPFLRVSEDGQVRMPGKSGGNGVVNLDNQVRQAKGVKSEHAFREIEDPYESMVKNILTYHKIAEKNRVGQSLVAAAEADPALFADLIEPLKPGERSRDSFYVWKDGKRQWFAADKDILDAITSLEEVAPDNIIAKAATKAANALKLGATRANPAFIITNFIRDAMYSTMTNSGWGVPFYNTIKGMAMQLSKDPKMAAQVAEALDAGLAYSGITELGMDSSRESVARSIKKAIGDDGFNAKFWNSPVGKFISGIGETNELIELAPKFAEYQRLVKQGYPKRYAARMAREVNIDFSRGGSVGKAANRYIAFFNPAIQGVSKIARTAAAHPGQFFAKTALYVMLPSLITWAMGHDDDEYKRMSRNIKDRYWVFKGPDNTWIRITKPDLVGLVGSAMERILDKAADKDPAAFRGLGTSIKEAVFPSYMPTVLGPIMEHVSNRNFFYGETLIPQSLQNLPPEMQYQKNTSGTAKFLGRMWGISPIIIDNYIKGYGGGVAETIAKAPDLYDQYVSKTGEEKKIGEMPIISRFTVDPYRSSESISRFYDIREQTETAKNGLKAMAKQGERGEITRDVRGAKMFEKAGKQISDWNKDIARIREAKNITPEQKRQRIDRINLERNRLAEKILAKYDAME